MTCTMINGQLNLMVVVDNITKFIPMPTVTAPIVIPTYVPTCVVPRAKKSTLRQRIEAQRSQFTSNVWSAIGAIATVVIMVVL